MIKLKTVTLAAVLIASGTSLALAQSGPATGGQPPVAGGANASNNGMPPATYKGPGGMPTYKGSDFGGGPALYNQAPGAAPAGNGMPPASYKGPGGMPTYKGATQ